MNPALLPAGLAAVPACAAAPLEFREQAVMEGGGYSRLSGGISIPEGAP